MEKTHWKKLSNPDYLGAYAFQPGEEKTLTIREVKREVVVGAEGRKEDCTVTYFVENEKPLILNATNSKMIQKVLETPYIEEWAGKRIVLGVERVSAFGEKVDAVRVKKKTALATTLACGDCGQIIADSGKFSAEQIARSTINAYGTTLCMECGTARKREKELKEDEPNENNAD